MGGCLVQNCHWNEVLVVKKVEFGSILDLVERNLLAIIKTRKKKNNVLWRQMNFRITCGMTKGQNKKLCASEIFSRVLSSGSGKKFSGCQKNVKARDTMYQTAIR